LVLFTRLYRDARSTKHKIQKWGDNITGGFKEIDIINVDWATYNRLDKPFS